MSTLSQPGLATPQRMTRWLVLVLIGYAVCVYGYMFVRSYPAPADNDTRVINASVQAALDEQSVTGQGAYSNGLSYIGLLALATEVTGVSVQTLQSGALLTLSVLLPLLAFVTYRELLGRPVLALFSTIVLMMQPEFLFVTWRGSHERMTWALALMSIYLMLRVIRGRNLTEHAYGVVLFYLISFALIATNAFFASAFIALMALSFTAALVFLALRRRSAVDVLVTRHTQRFLYATVACSAFFYVFIFFLYPPALNYVSSVNVLRERFAAVYLNAEEKPAEDPAASASANAGSLTASWSSQPVYIGLTLLNWTTLAASAVTFVVIAIRLLRRRTPIVMEDFPLLFLCGAYFAFGIQLVFATVMDTTGWINNFRVRLFTPTTLFATPLMVYGLYALVQWRRWAARAATVVVPIMMLYFSVASLLKATNEPMFNNQWLFMTPAETHAVTWADQTIPERNLSADFDTRVRDAYGAANPSSTLAVRSRFLVAGTRHIFTSDVSRLRWARSGLIIFYLDEQNLVYDNGQAQIVHLKAQSIFQR